MLRARRCLVCRAVYTGSREKTGKQHEKVVVKENIILCSEGQSPFAFANVQEVVAENNLIVGGKLCGRKGV